MNDQIHQLQSRSSRWSMVSAAAASLPERHVEIKSSLSGWCERQRETSYNRGIVDSFGTTRFDNVIPGVMRGPARCTLFPIKLKQLYFTLHQTSTPKWKLH